MLRLSLFNAKVYCRIWQCVLVNGSQKSVIRHTSDDAKKIYHQNNTDLQNIKIPGYKFPKAENEDTKRARLTWQSRKRGIAENCLLLSSFAEKYLSTMAVEDLELFDKILNGPTNDWDLYYWITGAAAVPEEYNNAVMQNIIIHCKNNEKETRFQQPSLNYKPVV